MQQLVSFVVRWILNTLGIWLSIKIFGTGYVDTPESITVFLLAGLIFSIINAILKPIAIILALPALLVTLGLFMLIVNGLMVYLALKLAPHISMTFWYAVLAGMVISLLNYVVSNLIDITPYVNAKGKN